MTISDPSQILQRVPELQDLIGDSKIRHAIESGDPFKIYRSLVLAKLFRRLPQHKDLLLMLTSQRRLFARGLKGTPALGTLNSVGFSFVGKDDHDTEGYYIALHAFVILFALPIVPLGSYLVQSTGEHQWRIFARVPLGIWGWLYTRGLASAMVLLVLLGGGTSLHQASTQDLTILNGFSEPLTITVTSKATPGQSRPNQTTVVPAQGKTTMNIKSGQQHMVASMARVGQVDVLNSVIDTNDRLTIWNVAGAAPLVRNHVVYYPTFAKPDNLPPAKQEVYCGQRLIEFGHIDYLFVDPPSSMSMSKHESTHTVQQLTIITEAKVMGAETCINWAFSEGQEKSLAEAARIVAVINDWKVAYAWAAAMAAVQSSPEAAIGALRAARKAHPESIELERGYREVMQIFGKSESLRKEYLERIRQKPDDPTAQYLLASIIQGPSGLQAMQTVHQRFPDFVPALASLAWRKLAHRDFIGGGRDLQQLRKLSASEADSLTDLEVRSLLGQHRLADAHKLMQQVLSVNSKGNISAMGAQLALIAQQNGENRSDVLAALPFADDQSRDLARVYAGLAPLKATAGESILVQMVQAMRDNPGKAIELAEKNTPLAFLPNEQQAFLFGLAMAKKNQAVVNRLKILLQISQEDQNLLRAYIDGANVDLDQGDFPPEMQTVAIFFRSRNPQLPASEREQLRKLAFQTDLQPNLVRHALNNWPQ